MKPIGLIDMHCDTLTAVLSLTDSQEEYKRCLMSDELRGGLLERLGQVDTMDDPRSVLSISKMPKGLHWAQFFAIFVPDECRGKAAIEYFDANVANFNRQMAKFSDRIVPCRTVDELEAAFAAEKFAGILAVEGGAALAGELSRVQVLADAGVRALTLVWNGANEIGSGNDNLTIGLTEFGRAVVPELERCGILIDVSHLNDKGFWDLCEIAQKPFIATHSNARAITSNRRNLTDEQIEEMARRGGLIGLNFYVKFLRDDNNIQSLDDLYRHVSHFLEHGAEKCLALGSDFDGAALPECLNSCEKAVSIYEYLLSRGLSQSLADDIMFDNVMRFFHQHLK